MFKTNIKKMAEKKDIKGLTKALKHKDHSVRYGAARALGRLGDPRAVEPLVQALKDDSYPFVREGAAQALGEIGETKAVPPLMKALKEEIWSVRQKAAEALVEIGDMRAAEAFVENLRHDEHAARKEAAAALDQLGWEPKNDEEKAHRLIAEAEVRTYSNEPRDELVKMGEQAVEPLIQALNYSDLDWWTRGLAAEVLGRIGDMRAVEALTRALYSSKGYVRDHAGEALVAIGDKSAMKQLAVNFMHSPRVRYRAAVSLSKTGDLDATAVTSFLLAIESIYLRRKQEAPSRQDWDPDWEPFLPEEMVEEGAEALASIGEKAIDPLRRAITHDTLDVRLVAKRALDMIEARNG